MGINCWNINDNRMYTFINLGGEMNLRKRLVNGLKKIGNYIGNLDEVGLLLVIIFVLSLFVVLGLGIFIIIGV